MEGTRYKVYLNVGAQQDSDGLAVRALDVQDHEAFDRMWRTMPVLSAEKLVCGTSEGGVNVMDRASGASKSVKADIEVVDSGPAYVAVRETSQKLHAGCFDADQVDDEYIRQVKRLRNGVVLERHLYDDCMLRFAYCELESEPPGRWADVATAHMKKAAFAFA